MEYADYYNKTNEAQISRNLLVKIALSREIDDSLATSSIGDILSDLESKNYFPWLLDSINPRTNPRIVTELKERRALVRLAKGLRCYMWMRTQDDHFDA